MESVTDLWPIIMISDFFPQFSGKKCIPVLLSVRQLVRVE